jgi:hypothetical protein
LKEPAVLISLVAAIISLGISVGLNLSQEQVGSIMAVVTIVAGLVIRSRVTPV